MAALRAIKVPEDSSLRKPNQIPFPTPSTAAQNPLGAIDEEETTSMRELEEAIDSHAEPIDLEATSNLHVDDQPGVQPPLAAQQPPMDVAQFQLQTLQLDCQIQSTSFTSLLFNLFSLVRLPMSLGCGDRTIIFADFKFSIITGFW